MARFKVSEDADNSSVEVFLQQQIPAAPHGYLRQLLKKGKVRSGERILSAADSVTAGMEIALPASQRLHDLLTQPEQSQANIDILYESREVLIVYKPAGLAIHNSQGHERDNLNDRVTAFLQQRGDKFRAAPVQRLDLETSGPVLFGKGKKSCSELGKLFMAGEVTKTYLALVSGRLQGRGELLSDIPAKGKIKVARTSYRVVISNESASFLEIDLDTGRQHQIRRQFADAGHPLYGDRRYRGPVPHKLGRLFLHCRRLAFVDPFTHQRVEVGCPLPRDLSRFLSRTGLEFPG